MLQETFLLLPGVQERTERHLWDQGIMTWDDLLSAPSVAGISKERLSFWKHRLRQAKTLLDTPDGINAIARILGSRHSWRAFHEVMENPRFVDIETTEYRTDITMIGVSDGEFYQAFIKGQNLDAQALRRAFTGASCIITFNGASFDLPIIEHRFPGLLPAVPHLDLRHIASQAGLRGGLKRIEQHLALRRVDTVRDMDGSDAIMLWYRHTMGDEKALRTLVDYNAADVLNLAPLSAKIIPALWRNVRHGEALPFSPMIRPIE
jgi:hypothetical protein